MMMKPLRILVAAVIAAGVAGWAAVWTYGTMNRNEQQDNGHVLTEKWSEFEKARKADRPQKEAEILLDIRTEAEKKHLPADFYDAGSEYIYARQRTNWKLQDSLEQEFEGLVRAFGEPIVTYTWMGDFGRKSSDERWAYVRESAAAFSRARHPEFYRTLSSYLGGALREFVQNDREFVLWDLLGDRHISWEEPEKDEIYAALQEEIGTRYPAEPCLRYERACRLTETADRKAALERLAADPAARAVAFYAREDLLYMRFDSLNRNGGVSADYKRLREDCRQFLKEKNVLAGSEARIAKACIRTENLLENLDSKFLFLSVEGDSVVIGFRNLSDAKLTMAGQVVTVVNPAVSYYATDTVKVPLPLLPDGEYEFKVKSGRLSDQISYRRFTLSMAQRLTAEGVGVYVADYQTGEPVGSVKITLRKENSTLASETLKMDGFTLLPDRFVQAMKKNAWYTLQASCTGKDGLERRSPELWVGLSDFEEEELRYEGTWANVYMDRGAYHPGDTLSFKTILYKGDLTESAAVVPETPLEIILYNAQNEQIDQKKLNTNEFGSAAEHFVLPVGQRNGTFFLQVLSGGRQLARRTFRVDEFILPNFTLSVDPVEELYVAGDTVRVTGSAVAYSGHSLSGARVSARVKWYGSIVSEQEMSLSEGRFSLSFPAKESGHYSVEIRVTDATGETCEAMSSVFVTDGLRLSMEVGPAAEGECVLADAKTQDRYSRSRSVVIGDRFHIVPTVTNGYGGKVPVVVDYSLGNEAGEILLTGTAVSGETVDFDLSSYPSGLYKIKAVTKDDRLKAVEEESRLLLVRPDDKVLDAPVSRVFISGPSDLQPGEKIRVQMGTADGEQWAVAALLGRNREILSTRKLHWNGERGKDGSIQSFEWDYPAEYPEAVRLLIFYFKHGEAVTYDREYRRVRTQLQLPLAFSSFTDRTLPGTEYTFTLRTLPDVEALAAVYDKSLDAFGTNYWPTVSLRQFSPAHVSLRSVCGSVGSHYPVLLTRSMNSMKMSYPMPMPMSAMADDVAEAGFSLEMLSAPAGGFMEDDEETAVLPAVRERFENALTFQPFLRSDADGNVSFSFMTSDRLSTYYVSVFAHDKAMRNALVREETVVTVPVKVSVAEPSYLYLGDKYRIAVSVANTSGKDLRGGSVRLQLFDTADWKSVRPVRTETAAVPMLAEASVQRVEFDIDVAEIMSACPGTLGILASYVCDAVSDAVFLPVPVFPAAQQLTEAHSAVLLAEMDREQTIARLRNAFVNVSGEDVDCEEITILDMVKAALPSKAEPAAADVLSLSEAWYVRMVAGSIGVTFAEAETPTEKLLEQILACRNADGGFAWFEGMKSSSAITAVLLERFAKVLDLLPAGASETLQAVLPDAVKFLDRNQFDYAWPSWCGGLSTDRYIYVRSFYPSVPFNVSASGDKKLFNERLKDFKKYAAAYLTPKSERGLTGQIFAKTLRLRTLQNLMSEPSGISLAKAWGVGTGAENKIRKSLGADVTSLLEYAVGHQDGGVYYPNLVMPFRGLLENEAYAHSMLSDLFAGLSASADVSASDASRLAAVADGVRLWLMLQKETQHWDEDPAFVDAVHSILQASEQVKATTVLHMEQTFEKPFSGIRAAGNGFTVERKFFRSVGVEEVYNDRTEEENRIVAQWQELRPGDTLMVGDRIAAEYRIWNAENRSFVRLSAPREASLVPVQQLSGPCGGIFRPLRVALLYSFQPQGYREVHADRTDYYFDTCPEENTTVREEFHVTRAGVFQAPVLTVESLYAPHYRANDGCPGSLVSALGN